MDALTFTCTVHFTWNAVNVEGWVVIDTLGLPIDLHTIGNACNSLLSHLHSFLARFGDEPLNSCEVMLRDMEEAKRTNNSITADLRLQQQQQLHQQSASAQPVAAATVDCVIVSGNYWPALPSPPGDGSELIYHRATKLLIETFQETYTKQKKPRKLDMAAHLGHVELELDFADGARRLFHVSPVQVG